MALASQSGKRAAAVLFSWPHPLSQRNIIHTINKGWRELVLVRVSSVLACFVSKRNEQANIYDYVMTCDPNKKGPATGTDKKRLAVMLTIKGITHVVQDEKLCSSVQD